MRKILPLLLLLLIASCDSSKKSKSGCVNDDGEACIEDNEEELSAALPAMAETFDVNISLINFDQTQEEKMMKAVDIIKQVVGSEEFRKKVISQTYNGTRTYVDNGGFNNSQIYWKILEASERLNGQKNNVMDVEVELYNDPSTTTIGYTYPSSNRIWVNAKYFNVYTPASVAANLFHEWLHKIGFGHDVNYSTSRDYSVPYAIGRMIGTLGRRYL